MKLFQILPHLVLRLDKACTDGVNQRLKRPLVLISLMDHIILLIKVLLLVEKVCLVVVGGL